MSFETAAIKPAVKFPEVHPYWAGPAVWRGHHPGVFRALRVSSSAMGGAPARHDWGAYVGFAARDGRPSANLIELAGGLAFAGVGLAGLQFNPLFDRRRLCGPWVLGSLSSPPWPLRRHAALVHPLLCRVRLNPWGVLADLVVVKLLRPSERDRDGQGMGTLPTRDA